VPSPTRAVPLLAILALAGCASDTGASADAVTIDSSDDACTVSPTELAGGTTTFSITNSGDDVTEVYVYDGDRVVTEKEDIGPGTTADLTVDLEPGDYEVACKPGMVGDGIRTAITVGS
jgi:iron uptake system component EfeO